MTTIQLKLPKAVARFYPKISEKVFLQALNESVRRLIDEERAELKLTKARIRRFERKYKCSFSIFAKRFSAAGNFETHEDYGEWSYLEEKTKRLREDIENYEKLAAA